MASMTASILIGSSYQNHGGICPTHQLLLSENSRPAWVLTSLESPRKKVVWIPTVNDMLEDGLLMVGLLVLRCEVMTQAAKFATDYRVRAAMYDDIAAPDRLELYRLCRQLGVQTKLAISVFENSSITSQLDKLEAYQFGVEVCSPVYIRDYSVWSQQLDVRGTLPTAAKPLN